VKPFTVEDGERLAAHLQAEVDRGVAARAEVAARAGATIACRRGCNACCEQTVMVFAPEARRIASFLMSPENAGARAAFLAAFPAWRERAGDGPERLAALYAAGDREAHRALHTALHVRRALCAFNANGDCTIYPVRPVLCRDAHALDTADACQPGATIPVRTLALASLDTFVQRARNALRVAHNALGEPLNRPAALCQAVRDLLG
jgi:Fe-S-cluster containining protein